MFLARLVPRPLKRRLRPVWHRVSLALLFWRKPGWRLYYDREVLAWIAVRPIQGQPAPLAVRSHREIRRWKNLGRQGDREDLVLRCIGRAPKLDVLYDVGASNGLYGFAAHRLKGCKVVFVEPYTPSIESILKSIHVLARHGAPQDAFEVVQAGIDEKEGFARLMMHGAPIAGETRTTFADSSVYAAEDRSRIPVTLSQWTKGVSLDSLVYTYDLPAPSVVKMDVDGFEVRAIAGAERLLAAGAVDAWLIEINGEANRDRVTEAMQRHGYVTIAHQKHHDGPGPMIGDWVFVRGDIADGWRQLVGNYHDGADD